ncbi:hypothetical protein ACHAP3_004157 [Botrytis cinerea]
MNYHSKPNKTGQSGPILPITYDANMNPRNIFLLDGTTPASIQERLAAALKDNHRRKEAEEADLAYRFPQSCISFTDLPDNQFQNQDILAHPYARHQDTESNYSNADRNLPSEGHRLRNIRRDFLMEPNMNTHIQLASSNDFAQQDGNEVARPHVLSGNTSRYRASNQFVQPRAPTISPTFGQTAEHGAVPGQYSSLDAPEHHTLSGPITESTASPTGLISRDAPRFPQVQHSSFHQNRRPRNGGHFWRNYNHFVAPPQQGTSYQPINQQSVRPQYLEDFRRINAYSRIDLYDVEAWAQRRQETGQVSPPLNYFTQSTTFDESYSGSATPAYTPGQNTYHDIQTLTYPQESQYTPNPANQRSNAVQSHNPHTITSMNAELDLPPSIDPYASQFSLPPSRKLQRRNRSFVPSSEDSQTSSGNYKGNPRAGIRELSDHLNCALWLTNLAADIQAHEVFDEIHTGAVSAFEITRPQGEYIMSAAKLIFKHPEAAALFKDQCNNEHGIIIRGRRVNARYNTFGYRRYKSEDKTRMISIEGPSRYVVYDDLKVFFETFCDHELSGWEYVEAAVKGNRKMIMGFARINGQATQCLEALQMHPVYGEHLVVQYAPDPCARDSP